MQLEKKKLSERIYAVSNLVHLYVYAYTSLCIYIYIYSKKLIKKKKNVEKMNEIKVHNNFNRYRAIDDVYPFESRVVGVPRYHRYAQVAGQLQEILRRRCAPTVLFVVHQVQNRRHVHGEKFFAQRVQNSCNTRTIVY